MGREIKEYFGFTRYRLEQYKELKNVDKKEITYPIKNKYLKKFYPFIDFLFHIYYIKKYRRKNSILHLGTHADALILKFIKPSPVIVNCLDLIPLVYPQKYSLYSRMRNKITFKAMTKADHFIAISKYTKKDMVEKLKIPQEKITVAYAGADLNHYKPIKKPRNYLLKSLNLDPKYKYIAYLGNEEERMNLLNQLKAFKKTKKYIKNLKFIKAGKANNPNAREDLIKFIQKEGIEKDVIFLDYVDEKLMPSLYSSIDAFIYVIHYAGFGLPPLEAMACGCPVITSNKTSLPEVVEEAGIQIDPNDIEGISKAIIKVISDKKTKEIMIKKGLMQSKKFGSRECGEKTVEAYKKILKSI
ncbi:glycosyltransferase family 4 protein [Candidatus Woesearchaeota archaeon]|nr:glycosyltransferase family 4 protein [Candidatus Woesearchaeota archaeon]